MRKLINFWRDQRGAAILEMAFVAPIIGGMAAVSFAAWDVATRQQDMRAALEVGAEYYMNGGGSDDVAKTAATEAWRNAPEDALVSSERSCRCGTVVTICTNLCTGDAPPSVYVRLTATGTSPEAMFTPHQSAERIVRVR
ncbi:MAG: pilus assembly protein [Lysobacteraceae bacterium]|nr:MAG: pilus assembly protein [Xanthomonadaceae bacterium]